MTVLKRDVPEWEAFFAVQDALQSPSGKPTTDDNTQRLVDTAGLLDRDLLKCHDISELQNLVQD